MEYGFRVRSRTYIEPESLKMVILLTKTQIKTLGCKNLAPKFSRSLLFGLRVGIAYSYSVPNQTLISAEIRLPPSPAYRQLRAMVERLQALKDMHQQEANRLEAHHASGETTVLPNVRSHIAWLDKQIAKLQGEINDHIDGHPELKQDADLIASIPGIGEATVAKVLAYAGDVRRFANARALAAFIGICPRQRQSGSSVKGRTMISRTGHADLRRALYMPGLVALRHNPILQVFGARMKANGRAPKAVVGAAMRKLAHLIYGVVKSGNRLMRISL